MRRLAFILIAVLAVRLAARLGFRIRFYEMWSGRIGHLAANTECLLSEIEAGIQPKSLILAFHNGPLCNEALGKMLARTLHVGPWRLVDRANRLFRGWERFVAEPAQFDRDIYNLWERQAPKLSFAPEERNRGEHTLRQMGIPAGAKWVCLVVRDAAYLPGLEYHAYRDTKIEDYMEACQMLASRGYHVVRMGAKVSDPIPLTTPKIIDYAMGGMRSDFMDIYLGAHCAFCLTNSTGIDAIPAVFRRPLAYVNMVPLEYLGTFHNGSLAIWKHHWKDGKRMSVADIVASGAGLFERADQYAEAGIELRDNTPEEIRALAEEMADDVENPHAGITDIMRGEESDNTKFWRAFPRSVSPYNNQPLHGENRMRIGREFLRGYSG